MYIIVICGSRERVINELYYIFFFALTATLYGSYYLSFPIVPYLIAKVYWKLLFVFSLLFSYSREIALPSRTKKKHTSKIIHLLLLLYFLHQHIRWNKYEKKNIQKKICAFVLNWFFSYTFLNFFFFSVRDCITFISYSNS